MHLLVSLQSDFKPNVDLQCSKGTKNKTQEIKHIVS